MPRRIHEGLLKKAKKDYIAGMQASRSPFLTRGARHLFLIALLFGLTFAGHATAFAGGGKAPLVSVSVFPQNITNESQDAVFTFTLSAPSSKNVPVQFVVGSSPPRPLDFFLVGFFTNTGQVVIPAGQLSVTVTLHTVPDDGWPSRETATLFVVNGRGYHIGAPSHATVTIHPQS